MNKILFVVDERKSGGASKVLEMIFNNIPELKADILVLHNNGDRFENLKNVNMIFGSSFFDVCDLSLKQAIKKFQIIKIIKKLRFIFLLKTGLIKYSIIKERKKMNLQSYDIEISFKDGFGTYFVAYGDSKKKIRWLHNDYSMNNPGKHYKKSYTNAIKEFDKVVAIGKTIKDNFNEKYGMGEKTIVIPNIVEKPVTCCDKTNKTKEYDFELLCIGRLAKVKRYDMLIDIIAKLEQNNLFRNSILRIVGGGEEEVYLKNKIKELELDEKIIMYGNKNEPWKYATNSDLFVMCSKYEACPLTVVESQLVGIPVISVNFSSAKELINEKNGFIVDNNFEDLYNNIAEIIKKRKILNKKKENLKNYIYNNDKIISDICKLLEI